MAGVDPWSIYRGKGELSENHAVKGIIENCFGFLHPIELVEISYSAKLQNTPPLICISLNKNSDYCCIPRSSKHTDTCK